MLKARYVEFRVVDDGDPKNPGAGEVRASVRFTAAISLNSLWTGDGLGPAFEGAKERLMEMIWQEIYGDVRSALNRARSCASSGREYEQLGEVLRLLETPDPPEGVPKRVVRSPETGRLQ